MELILWLLLAPGMIHGFVRAEGSREPVPFAVVELSGSDRQTQTDRRGYYVFTGVEPGERVVLAQGLGYAADSAVVRVPDGGAVRADFALAEAPVALPSISATVTGGTGRAPAPVAGPQPIRITALTISRTPGLAEPDVLRAVQTLPSFAAASDFSTALYVRGSSPDQTMITLDGAPLFNPYHLGGVFAAIDPDAVAAVEARPGALPAGGPDRLAGSVDILTRDGGRDRVRSTGGLGLVSSRASVNGPLPGRRGSFLLSARRTYLDLVTGIAESFGAIPESLPYGFTDAHLKLTHDVGATGQAYASAYMNRERLREPGTDAATESWSWGTVAGSAGWRSSLAPGFTLYLNAAGSAFDATLFGWDDRAGPPGWTEGRTGEVPVSRSDVASVSLAADASVHRRAHTFRFGVRSEGFSADHMVDPRWAGLDQVLPELSAQSDLTLLSAYAEDEWAVTDRLMLRAGLRVLRTGDRPISTLPRVGLRYQLNDGLALVAGGGRYAQPVRSLRNEEALLAGVFAYDLLTGVPASSPLPTADDAVLGLEWAGEATSVRIEGFGKRLHDIPLVPIGIDPEDAPVLAVDELREGSGRVLGLEVSANRAGRRWDATLSYALTATEHTIGGISYTPRYQRLHLLDVSASRSLGDDGRVSIRLAAGSGQPATAVIGSLSTYGYDPVFERFNSFDTLRLYGDHNTARLSPYLRLDVGLRKSYERNWFGRAAQVTPYVQVLNVLNSANPLWTEISVFDGVRQEDGPRLPILPTLGVEWRF